jgi:Pregnancy-associated plasma protein-A
MLVLKSATIVVLSILILLHNKSTATAHNHDHDHDEHSRIVRIRTSSSSSSSHADSSHKHDRHLDSNEPIERCGARDPTHDEFQTASKVVAKYMTKKLLLQADQVSLPFVTVDTYFHVITDGSNGALSNEQLQDQLQVLNDSYRPYGFTFQLLGTTTTDNASWYRAGVTSSAQTEMKQALRAGDASTLNVYFNRPSGSISGTLLGYATFPWQYASDPDDDGVVIYSASLPFGDIIRFNEGKTLVHETGHWLGLYHTFNTDFGRFQLINIFLYLFKVRNGCNTSGDDVRDTPRQRSSTSGCPIGRDSCPFSSGLDPINNYMDYSDDSCYSSFTPGQQDRMMAMWAEYRAV